MDPQRAEIHVDARIARLAEAQSGAVARFQLLAAGVTADQIKPRLGDGRLRCLHRGVYFLGQRRPTRPGLRHAALLAVGGPAALSHREAGAFWEMRVSVGGAVEVTLGFTNGRQRREGIVMHRAPLEAGDWVRRDGLRVTSPARTLLDLGSCLGARQLERALDESYLRGLVSAAELYETIERNAGRAGTASLLEVLEGHELGSTATESRLEEEFLAAYRRCGRHELRTQVPLPPYRADFFFAAERALVEVDGPAHRLRSRQRSDAERDKRLGRRGLLTIRVTDHEIDEDVEGAVRRVDRRLDVRAGEIAARCGS